MSYLRSITKSSSDNLGGNLLLQIARKADIVSIPDPVAGTIYGDIVFDSGKGWYQWDVTFESLQISSSDRVTREGFVSPNNKTFKVPNDLPGIREMFLRAAANDEFIVLFKDASGRTKLFGTLDRPVRFSFTHDGGGSPADGNFYQGKFYYEGPDNIYHYVGGVSAPINAPRSIVKFKGPGQLDSEAVVIAILQPGETLMIVSDFGFETFYVIQ